MVPKSSVPSPSASAAASTEGPFLGIDVSKDKLDLAVDQKDGIRSFANDDSGIARLLAILQRLRPRLIVLEATGGYERRLLYHGLDAGLPFSRVQPGRVRYYAKAQGLLAKTDAIDARAIASFARAIMPAVTKRRSKNQEELEALLVCRRQLIATRTAHTNQAQMADSSFARRSLTRVLRLVQKEVDALDERIAQIIDSDEDLCGLRDLLCSTKGVGPTTAATLISQLPEIGTVDRCQISALVGLAPYNHDSGILKGKRAIFGGRAEVRSVLYMATLAAIRFNPVIKCFAERLRNAGKVPKVVIVACMRKLLTILNAMARDKRPWSTPARLAKA